MLNDNIDITMITILELNFMMLNDNIDIAMLALTW